MREEKSYHSATSRLERAYEVPLLIYCTGFDNAPRSFSIVRTGATNTSEKQRSTKVVIVSRKPNFAHYGYAIYYYYSVLRRGAWTHAMPTLKCAARGRPVGAKPFDSEGRSRAFPAIPLVFPLAFPGEPRIPSAIPPGGRIADTSRTDSERFRPKSSPHGLKHPCENRPLRSPKHQNNP